MRMKVKALAAAAVISCIGAVAVLAQDNSPTLSLEQSKQAVVKTGEYRNLTPVREMKLKTAPYLNPKLLEKAAVVYKYDVGMVAQQAGYEAVIEGLKSGKIALAEVTEGENYAVVPAGHPAAVSYWQTIESGKVVPEAGRFVFVSVGEAYEGVKNSGALVTWDAGAPVSMKKATAKGPDAGAPANPGNEGQGW